MALVDRSISGYHTVTNIRSIPGKRKDYPMATEPRTQHPFHMYDAIIAQPQAWAAIIQRIRPLTEQIAPRLAQAQRIFIVAIGTSFHAAEVGYHLFRYYGVAVPIQ